MTFTVLSDPQINDLLEGLSIDEIEDLRKALAQALNQYSGGAQDVEGDVFQEPREASTLHTETRVKTRFASACGPGGIASKVVSTNPEKPLADMDTPDAPTGALTLFSPNGSPLALLATPTLTPFRTALSSACLLWKRASIKTITVFGAGSQAYWHIRLALMLRGPTIRHVNIINHRFSSSAASILKRFTLIPQEVKDREGWGTAKFSVLTKGFVEYSRLVKEYMRDADVIYCCTKGLEEGHDGAEGLFDANILTSHEGRKKGRLICAVGGVEGQRRELPDDLVKLVTKRHVGQHRHIHKHADEGGVIVVDTLAGAMKHATELLTAGVEPGQMVELGELVMLHRLKREEEAAAEAELSAATSSSQMSSDVDLDSLSVDSYKRTPSMSAIYGSSNHRSSSRSPRSSTTDLPRSPSSSSPSRKGSFPLPFRRSSGGQEDKPKKEGQLARWMRDGTVVYRSVGVSAMDLVVGLEIVRLAREKGIGTQVPDL